MAVKPVSVYQARYPPSREQKFEHSVHVNSDHTALIAECSNYIQDVANTFNARTFADMTFPAFPKLNEDIAKRKSEVCDRPVDPGCKKASVYPYRPADGVCNNLEHPLWGATHTAQNRLLPPRWETIGHLLFFTNSKQTELDIVPDGVVIADRDFIHLQIRGTGNARIVLEGSGMSVEVVLIPKGTSFISVNGVSQGLILKFDVPLLYPDVDGYQLFTIAWKLSPVTKTQFILVARGPECSIADSEIVFLKAIISVAGKGTFTQGLVSTFKPESASSYNRFLFPIGTKLLVIQNGLNSCTTDNTILEEDEYVLQTGPTKNPTDVTQLKPVNIPYVYLGHSLIFEVRHEGAEGTFLRLKGEKGVVVTYSIFKSHVTSQVDGAPIKTYKAEIPIFSGAKFSKFWITWLKSQLWIGGGDIVGKNEFPEAHLDLSYLGYEYDVDSVYVGSAAPSVFKFNIVQINVPRHTSVTGRPLPSARTVSLKVHDRTGPSVSSPELSMSAMQMGQFDAHDVIATPTETSYGEPISCCVNGQPVEPELLSHFCFNIDVEDTTNSAGSQGSFPYGTGAGQFTCLPFTRTASIIDCDAPAQDLRQRQQPNAITSAVDASNVYGSSYEEISDLRATPTGEPAHTSHLLATSDGATPPDVQLPVSADDGEAACNNDDHPKYLCFKAGDFRNNENPQLNSMHTVWMREHNRIAGSLAKLPGSPGIATVDAREKVFQESRKILIAEMQVVTYSGYFLSWLDKHIFNLFDLGYAGCKYDKNVDHTILNDFGVAYRMGHTWMHELIESFKLQDVFFDPIVGHTGKMDDVLKFMVNEACPDTDERLETVATQHLFPDTDGNQHDIASLNIQRGRDHGLPGYVAYRNYFRVLAQKEGWRFNGQLIKVHQVETWNDVIVNNIMSKEVVSRLRQTYDCPDDIDLFTAALSETALWKRQTDFPGSTANVGEMLTYIIGSQMKRLKQGDRFWFECDFPNAKHVAELKKATLSRILCDNSGISEVQPDAFLRQDISTKNNKPVPCKAIPIVDLEALNPWVQIAPAPEPVKPPREVQEQRMEELIELIQELDEFERKNPAGK